MERSRLDPIAWIGALLLASSAALAAGAPAARPVKPPKCHASEQLVRVKAFEDRGASVHVELIEMPSGRAVEPIDVAKPGHAYYARRFGKPGALACLPVDPVLGG